MNKLIIPIIIILIIVAGIGAYFIFQKPDFPEPISRCGNGICEKGESVQCPRCVYDPINPCKVRCTEGTCPRDCNTPINATKTCSKLGGDVCSSSQTCFGEWLSASDNEKCCSGKCQAIHPIPSPTPQPTPTPTPSAAISPFGLWDATLGYGIPDISSMSDLGVQWEAVAIPPVFLTNWQEWESTYNKYKNTGITPVPLIDLISSGRNGGSKGGLSLTPSNYYNSVKSAVSFFNDIDYWMLGVEVDTDYNKKLITVEQYALYTRLTYKAMKESRLSVKLVAAGTRGIVSSYTDNGFFALVFEELEKLENIEKNPSSYDWSENPYNLTQEDFNLVFAPDSYSQYMDGHHFSNFDMQNTPEYYKESTVNLVQAIKNLLNSYGYNNIILWNTQTGTYSGQITTPISPYQSEKNQAENVIKKYIYSLAVGVDKIFWTTTYEILWNKNPEHFFSKVGLVYNGFGEDDLGKGAKKLSYYTYKKMVEVLEDSDWNNIQKVQESGDIYIYKFLKNGKLIWVAWNDNIGNKDITISGISSAQVKITEAIPKYESGKEVTNYNTAFNIETKTVSAGKITITLGDNPVFVEE